MWELGFSLVSVGLVWYWGYIQGQRKQQQKYEQYEQTRQELMDKIMSQQLQLSQHLLDLAEKYSLMVGYAEDRDKKLEAQRANLEIMQSMVHDHLAREEALKASFDQIGQKYGWDSERVQELRALFFPD